MQVPGADRALDHLMAWASRGRWRERLDEVVTEHLAEVCARFELVPSGLREALGTHHHGSVMGCVFEDFCTRRFGRSGANVIDAFLEHRAWRESPSGRAYLRSLRDSVMSLYEVIDLAPGSHLVLKDLIRGGTPVTVDERLGSRSAARWDRMGARVLAIDGSRCLSGAVLHFDIEPAESVLRIFRGSLRAMEARAPRAVDDDLRVVLLTRMLAGTATAFTGTCATATLSVFRQPAPHLVNFDGEDVVFATVRFPVAEGQATQVPRVLDEAEGFERGSEGRLGWIWRGAPDIEPARPKAEAAPAAIADACNDGEPRMLGHVMLEAHALVLQTNSVDRAGRGTAQLRVLLGNLIGEPQPSTRSVAEVFAQWRAQQPSSSGPATSIPADVQVCLLHPRLERHYRRSLDEPIPMLGDVSPRMAVQSEEGRERVITWLKYLENTEERHARETGQPTFDFTWMWRELGILDERG